MLSQPLPFAYGSLTGNPPLEQSVEAVAGRPGAQIALSVLSTGGSIWSRSGDLMWSSSDLRLLCVHFLIRKTGRRADGASRYEITDKGRDVIQVLDRG